MTLISQQGKPHVLAGQTCLLCLDRPLIMGVLNVTPDSFFADSRKACLEAALRHGVSLAESGADIIDIGGESTRPGAPPVEEGEEMDRIIPLVEALRREVDLPLSIDTTKSSVAREALAAGAEFINDISGLRFDPDMPKAIAEFSAGVFLMHTRGRPDTMQLDTRYADLLEEILSYLRESISLALGAGVSEDHIAIDPGIGFGKSVEGNLEILRHLKRFQVLRRPILLGTSRKGFIGKVLGQPDPSERLYGTLATVALGVAEGAHIFRVHDVRPAKETAMMAWSIVHSSPPDAG